MGSVSLRPDIISAAADIIVVGLENRRDGEQRERLML